MSGRLLAFCMAVVMGASLCRAQPEPLSSNPARGQLWFQSLFEIRTRPHVGYYAIKQVHAAAGSDADVVSTAHARLAVGEGEVKELEFAIDVIAAWGDVNAQNALIAAARNEALPLRVRRYAAWLLEDSSGWSLSEGKELREEADTFEDRLPKVKAFIAGRPEASGGFPIDIASDMLRKSRRYLKDHPGDGSRDDLTGIWKYMGMATGRILEVRDSAAAVPLLAEHLEALQSIKPSRGHDAKVFNDGVVGEQMFNAIYAIQWHAGPLPGETDSMATRKQVSPVAKATLRWWEENKHHHPDLWRMSNLAGAGYAVKPDDKPHVITGELIRAVRAGTPMEAKAAADVLRSLAFCAGTVPPRQDTDEPADRGVELVDALIRGEVIEDASEEILAGKVVSWDAASQRWVQTEEER